jgi:hypothetical protein
MAVTMRGCERSGHTDCYYDGNAEGVWTHSRACGWWWKRYQTAEAKGYLRALEDAIAAIRAAHWTKQNTVGFVSAVQALKEKVRP